MNLISSSAQTPPVQMLTGSERTDFDLVVANARSMGWLTAQQNLTAMRCDSCIIVRDLAADEGAERRYEDAQRWLYQLLYELSQGLWKQAATQQH